MEIEGTNSLTPVAKRHKKDSSKSYGTPLLIPPSPCMKRLGYGTGVNVYLIERFSPLRGCYRSPWAVKKISSRLRGEIPEVKIRLEEETEILKSLSHPNIIGFRSQGETIEGKPCLVMESGKHSLNDAIEERSDFGLGAFPASDILKVANSLASALDYLHRECLLLHGDIKSANVLVNDDFSSVKLCDFGVTIKLNENLVVDDPKKYYIGTECWTAREVFVGDQLSNKTDMYSYGLVLWEMITLSIPHILEDDDDSLEAKAEDDQSAVAEMEARREEEYENSLGTRPALPSIHYDSSYNKVLEIFYVTTNEEAQKRPSAKCILETFFQDKQKLTPEESSS